MTAITDLIALLSAEGCPATAFYDYLNGVTATAGRVTSMADQVGTAGAFLGQGSPLPAIDTSAGGGVTSDGTQSYMVTGVDAAFQQARANWMCLIGTVGKNPTGGATMGIVNAGGTRYVAISGFDSGFVGAHALNGTVPSPQVRDGVVRCHLVWYSTLDVPINATNIGVETIGRLRNSLLASDGAFLPSDSYLATFGSPITAFNTDTFRTIIFGTGDITRNALLAIQNFAVTQRGATVVAPKNALITIGDSLTVGFPLATANSWPALVMQDPMFANYYDMHNVAIDGDGAVAWTTQARVRADPSINPIRSRTIVTVWAGSNDIGLNGVNDVTLMGVFGRLCAERRALGCKVVCATMIKRGTFDATMESYRVNFNAWLMANWPNFADAIVDVASNPNFSDPNNATWYDPDTAHLTAAGYASVANDPAFGWLPVLKGLDWTVKPGTSNRSSRALSTSRLAPSQRG